MNKIERAIYDCKQRIAKLEFDRLLIIKEIDIMTNQLYSLEGIERDKSIPHKKEDKQ